MSSSRMRQRKARFSVAIGSGLMARSYCDRLERPPTLLTSLILYLCNGLLRTSVALFSGKTVPAKRLCIVLNYTYTLIVHEAEVELRFGQAASSRRLEPAHRRVGVARSAAARLAAAEAREAKALAELEAKVKSLARGKTKSGRSAVRKALGR